VAVQAVKMSWPRSHARGQVMAQFAVSIVALLSVTVAIADVALWLHAQNIVIAAAQEGATVASREGGTALAGRQAATEFLQAGLGPSADVIQQVQVQLDADTATVEIAGQWQVPPLGALVRVPLHARANMLREAFRPGGR